MLTKDKYMNVLSVDFDFFQNPQLNTFKKYPIGIDLPLNLSNSLWADAYLNHGKQINRVEFDQRNYNILKTIICNQKKFIPIKLSNSHVEAYYFLLRLLNSSNKKKVNLVNVDMHHDIINNNEKIDCGNWIGNLAKSKMLGNFSWVAKPLSQEMYGLSDDDMVDMKAIFDLSCFVNMNFDAIFICRSNPWFPPHLDKYFAAVVRLCQKHFYGDCLEIDGDIKRERHIRDLPLNGAWIKFISELQSYEHKQKGK